MGCDVNKVHYVSVSLTAAHPSSVLSFYRPESTQGHPDLTVDLDPDHCVATFSSAISTPRVWAPLETVQGNYEYFCP